MARLSEGLTRLRRDDREAVARQKELTRLRALEHAGSLSTRLPGCDFEISDGPAFASQWEAIFEAGCYAFVPRAPEPRILDCGANIGVASLYWSRTVRNARITAFEPDPVLAAMLRRNLIRCGANEVEIVEAAVWQEAGSMGFLAGSPDAGRLELAGGGERVRTVRLRDYLGDPVALLKLDIEGAEVEVLRDCADRLALADHVFVEYHSFDGQPQHLDEVVSILTRAGFRLHIRSELASARPFVRRDIHLGMDLQLNIYAFRCEAATA
jgi:FkbM family methyltransferase